MGELVNRARFGRERVILTEHGTPLAAIISVEELTELQAAVDASPPGSTPLDTAGLLRLRVGEARIMYEIDDTQRAIHILTVGRVGR